MLIALGIFGALIVIGIFLGPSELETFVSVSLGDVATAQVPKLFFDEQATVAQIFLPGSEVRFQRDTDAVLLGRDGISFEMKYRSGGNLGGNGLYPIRLRIGILDAVEQVNGSEWKAPDYISPDWVKVIWSAINQQPLEGATTKPGRWKFRSTENGFRTWSRTISWPSQWSIFDSGGYASTIRIVRAPASGVQVVAEAWEGYCDDESIFPILEHIAESVTTKDPVKLEEARLRALGQRESFVAAIQKNREWLNGTLKSNPRMLIHYLMANVRTEGLNGAK